MVWAITLHEHTAKGRHWVLVGDFPFIHKIQATSFFGVWHRTCTFLIVSREHPLLLYGMSVLVRLCLNQKQNRFSCTEEFLWLSLEKTGEALPFLLREKPKGGDDDGVHVWRSLSMLGVPSAWVFCRSRTCDTWEGSLWIFVGLWILTWKCFLFSLSLSNGIIMNKDNHRNFVYGRHSYKEIRTVLLKWAIQYSNTFS